MQDEDEILADNAADIIHQAMDIVLRVIVTVAGADKAEAIRGAEALHGDVLKTIERYYENQN